MSDMAPEYVRSLTALAAITLLTTLAFLHTVSAHSTRPRNTLTSVGTICWDRSNMHTDRNRVGLHGHLTDIHSTTISVIPPLAHQDTRRLYGRHYISQQSPP